MGVPLKVEIDRAGDVACCTQFDAIEIAIRSDLAATRTLRKRDDTRKRAGLSLNFTAKSPAKATVHASAAAWPRLRQNRQWRGERMPAQLARCAFKNNAGTFHWERWHRIGF